MKTVYISIKNKITMPMDWDEETSIDICDVYEKREDAEKEACKLLNLTEERD